MSEGASRFFIAKPAVTRAADPKIDVRISVDLTGEGYVARKEAKETTFRCGKPNMSCRAGWQSVVGGLTRE